MEPVLITEKLSKMYNGRKTIEDISITLNRGDIYGLVGQNGAGKTTLIKLMAGLVKPSVGSVAFPTLENKVVNGSGVGITIEKPGLLPNFTAFDHVRAKGLLYGCNNIEMKSCLECVSLLSDADIKVKNFSMGMQQRLAIGLALLGKPEIILFDEPINGLDPQGIKWFRNLILRLNSEKKITFLISSHILNELRVVATKYGFIHQGKLLLEISAKDLERYCETNNITFEDFYFKLIQGEINL